VAIAADTWVETINGRMPAHQITSGTYVFGMDGLPTQVKSVQTYTPSKMYYVEFSDGSNVTGDKFLTFPVRTFAQRVNTAKSKGKFKTKRKRVYRYKDVIELESMGLRHPRQPNRFQYTVDTIEPLQYGYEDHAVPPFVAGLWFANNRKNNKYLIADHLKTYVKSKIQASRQFMVVESKQHFVLRPSVEAMFLKDYAVIPTKEFPYKYLYGTPEQRLEFLQGYFAMRPATFKTDIRFFKVRAALNKKYPLQMIQVLCESLGIKTNLFRFTYEWSLEFKTNLSILPNQLPAKRKFGERHRQIVKVEQCPTRPCVHIETEKPIAVTDSFVPICL
jgi:hypothetical protein